MEFLSTNRAHLFLKYVHYVLKQVHYALRLLPTLSFAMNFLPHLLTTFSEYKYEYKLEDIRLPLVIKWSES